MQDDNVRKARTRSQRMCQRVSQRALARSGRRQTVRARAGCTRRRAPTGPTRTPPPSARRRIHATKALMAHVSSMRKLARMRLAFTSACEQVAPAARMAEWGPASMSAVFFSDQKMFGTRSPLLRKARNGAREIKDASKPSGNTSASS
eukprot:4293715-Pleurochrysis_carterae.AAC.2